MTVHVVKCDYLITVVDRVSSYGIIKKLLDIHKLGSSLFRAKNITSVFSSMHSNVMEYDIVNVVAVYTARAKWYPLNDSLIQTTSHVHIL